MSQPVSANALGLELGPGELFYQLPRFLKTQQSFRELIARGDPDNPSAICIHGYFGGWGSGKTTIGKWIVFDSMVCYAGIKVLVVRDTFSSLNLTTKQELLHRMVEGDPAGRNIADLMKESWNEQRQTFTIRNGSQCTFGGLDRVEKWGSTEFGMIYVDEASLIGEQDIPFLLSRLRQPAPKCRSCLGSRCALCGNTGHVWGPDYRRAIILTSNHVYTEHHLYKAFVGTPDQPRKKNHFYVETSSYENAPENGGFLPPGYLESLAQSGDERMVSVYMGGQWGVVPKGTPVYQWVPRSSGRPWHERPCEFDPSRPIWLSFDFGYRFPFVTFHQLQARGRWRILHEFTMPSSRTEELCFGVQGVLRERFPNARLGSVVYGDPAGLQNHSEGQNDATTVESVFRVPFRCAPSTEATKRGRRTTIQKRLALQVEGEPLLAVDPRYCPRLCEAFRGMYRFPEMKQRFETENYKEEPLEEHPFCDVMHSVEYFALNHFNEQSTEAFRRAAGQVVVPRFNFGGYDGG